MDAKRIIIISLFVGYFLGCLFPVISVAPDPNYQEYQQKKDFIY